MKIEKNETLPLSGYWKLTANHKGVTGTKGFYKMLEGPNIICTVGKQLIGDMIIDRTGYDTGITYQAIGTGTATPLVSDTQLTAEVARKAITSRTRLTNVVTFSTFLTAAESTFNIKEAGDFGHSTATSGTNSGIILSHWLVAFDNSAGNFDITLDHVLTIS